MGWQDIAWAKQVKTGSVGAKAVLLVLADYADEAHSCYPSQKRLAEETEQGERTVRRHLATLEELGLIKVQHRAIENGGWTSNRYMLQVATSTGQIGRSDEATGQSGQGHTGQSARSSGQSGQGEGVPVTTPPGQALAYEPPVELLDEPKERPPKRRTGIPEDFPITDAMGKFAVSLGLGVPQVRWEHDKFRDHWRGNGETKQDWETTWRNWMRRASERAGNVRALSAAQPKPIRSAAAEGLR